MKNIIISNPKNFQETLKKFKADGVKKIHVIADFDRTLTKNLVNGKRAGTLIRVLRDNNYLTPDYPEKSRALLEHYHPIEINPKLSLKVKKKAMMEWWTKQFTLLLASGLTKKDIIRAVGETKVKLRVQADNFFKILKINKIPLVIFSATGLGEESIQVYLKNHKLLHNNIHLMANAFVYDKKGKAIAVKKPIIHVFNKAETLIHGFSFYPKIEKRQNVILLGDSLGDVGMVEGFKYDNLIKVGFLNEDIKANLPQYKKAYDVLILNDGPMTYINQLLKKLI